MKTETFSTPPPHSDNPSNHVQKHSAGARYILAIALLLVVYLLSSWNTGETESLSFSIAPSFMLFWLAGGSLTLGILALAAKKNG